jgi:RNA polymerase sigma factor (TIGR02999 family)
LNQESPTQIVAERPTWHADFVSVYEALKKIARRQRRDAHDTLNTTGIVHELYLQLHDRNLDFQAQRQFYNYAAQAMRHLLIDRARTRRSQRRGGALQMVSMLDAEHEAVAIQHQTLELEQALAKLAERDARACEVFCLFFFVGLTNKKIAELLNVSTRTIDRDWLFARAWVQARIDQQSAF